MIITVVSVHRPAQFDTPKMTHCRMGNKYSLDCLRDGLLERPAFAKQPGTLVATSATGCCHMRTLFRSAGRHSSTRLGVQLQRRAHLITTHRVESRFIATDPYLFPPWLISSPFLHYHPFSTQPKSMSALDSITQALANLSITPSETIEHAPATSAAAWKEALQTAPKTPKEFELLKVLVFKPKTAKSAIPVPVVVVARDGTETSSSSLGKKFNLKELRLASEDLLSEFFSLNKDSRTSSIISSLILLCSSN